MSLSRRRNNIPALGVTSQVASWGPQQQRQTKSTFGTVAATAPSLAFLHGAEKPQAQLGGFSAPGKKREERVGWRGISLKLHLSTISLHSLSVADSSTRVSGTEGRGPRLRKENPRNHYAVWETKTRGLRMRQLPTDPLSCGNQPAHIRMIIVAAAALGLLSHSLREQNRMH